MTASELAHQIEDFLADSRNAVVIEDGRACFDMTQARYSVTDDRDRCLLHLWSDEGNIVRRVISAERKPGALALTIQKFGQSRPQKLEICADRDRRSPSARRAVRTAYQRLLERVLPRQFPGHRIEKISSAMDLERSFGPAYTRCLLRKGHSALAVLGVNGEEQQPTVDAALTFALLWHHRCRERETKQVMEGVLLVVPPKRSATVLLRAAHLDPGAVKVRIFELDEREESAIAMDSAEANIATRLVHCPDETLVRQRFTAAIDRVNQLAPGLETHVISSTELAFRLHGLEVARCRAGISLNSFRQQQEIVFGAGAYETVLTEDNQAQFAELLRRAREMRRAGGDHRDPLWRMQPERWLESLVLEDVSALDARLRSSPVYSQVPAFSASDRGMIDVLCLDRDHRLVVLELKANEDIHLPMQGLDYWARVRWHQQRREFQQYGYFSGTELSPAPPLLYMVAPALHVHPATDILLSYLSPHIEWTLLGVDERWREELRVVFRKSRSSDPRGDAKAAAFRP